MRERLRQLAVPGFLALCLLLGGSVQGVLGNLLLQLGGLALLAWAALTLNPAPHGADGRFLGWLAVAIVLLLVAQLLPMPPSAWTLLPERDQVAAGYRLLGQELPWLPWSLDPQATLSAALALLPPVGVMAGILRLGAHRSSSVALAVVLTTMAGVVLGVAQVTGGSGYLYELASRGQAAGFFANANYMGTLLLASIPFAAALFGRFRAAPRKASRRIGVYGLAAGTAAMILLGLALNGSAAAVLLSLPVLLASAALLVERRGWARGGLLGSAAGVAALGCLALVSLPGLARGENAISVSTRQEIYARSLQVAADMFPAGAGVGAFARVYPLYERPDSVDWVYVNHAHSDYLEIVLEAGLPGLLLLLAFLLWWGRRVFQIWNTPASGSFARAATIASAAILAHSAVDFPVRTAAIAAVLAACVALMANPPARRAAAEEGVRTRPVRHLTLQDI